MTISVSDAIERRMSVRAFRSDPVPDAIVRDILERARRSPSGGNLQPWNVRVVSGARLTELRSLISTKLAAGEPTDPLEFQSYPQGLWEPMRTYRSDAGRLRYEAFGYPDKDPAGLTDLQRRNYDFFGAPVGIFFYLDRRVGPPQWADLGMFLMAVMLLAVERGLDTCPQQVWGNWNKTLAEFFSIPDNLLLFCGMSLGYRDEAHSCNAARTDRSAFESFAMS